PVPLPGRSIPAGRAARLPRARGSKPATARATCVALGDGIVARAAVVAVVVLVARARTAHGQPGLGLGEAVAAAGRASPGLADAKLGASEAGLEVEEAAGAFDLRLETSGSYSESFAPVYVSSLAQTRIVRLRDLVFDQQVVRRFSTGTEAALGYSSLTESVLGSPADISLTREALQLRLSQALLRGRSPSANLAPMRAAERRGEAARLALRARAAGLIRAVEIAYWELSYAEREADIQERALEAARRHLDETRRRVRVGRVAPADMLVVERAVAVAADELVAADARRRTRALELARLTGIDAAAARTRDRPRPRGAGNPGAVLGAVRAGPAGRVADLLRDGQQEAAHAIDDRSLPRLDLVVSAGPSGEQPSFGQALESMARFDELAWSAGLVFSYVPGGRAEAAARTRAEAERRRAELARQVAWRDIEDRVRKLTAT